MSDFFLTTASNSSMEFHPENTLTNFTTRLAKELHLDESWRVGLADISIPKTWVNISEGGSYFKYIEGEEVYKLKIDSGYYETPTDLTEAIEDAMNGTGTDAQHYNTFKLNRKTRSVTIQNTTLLLSNEMKDLLGINTPQGNIDMHLGYSGIYVYLDILNFSHVGDVMAPLLSVISVRGKHYVPSFQRFDRIHYKTLKTFDFQSLNFVLTTDYGTPILFASGKVLLTLHFKQI